MMHMVSLYYYGHSKLSGGVYYLLEYDARDYHE